MICRRWSRRLAPRIHFVHLRNVRRDSEEVPCSFFEDEHLAGQADMVAVIAALLAEEKRRRAEGRSDAEIPMRPDHGQEILDDLKRGAQPGYPAIGRLKGLAELRGVMTALGHPSARPLMPRLMRTTGLPAGVRIPGHDRRAAAGIVHLGVGAFHKAHQAVYTDDAMAQSGGDWMIDGVSLRSSDVADALNPQKGLYTLITRGREGVSARIVGSIRRVLVAPRRSGAGAGGARQAGHAYRQPDDHRERVRPRPEDGRARPQASGDRRRSRRPQQQSEAPSASSSPRCTCVRRFSLPPFTLLSCDNLPSNGKVLRRLVLEFAAERDPEMVSFIEDEVSFPSTMVDRITPASTEQTLADAERLTGRTDLAAVETEPFSQWIIEDDFVAGRPDWEAGGALFVGRRRALREDEAPDAQRRPFDARLCRLHRRAPLRARLHGRPGSRIAGPAPHERGGAHAGSGAGHRSRPICRRPRSTRFANPAIAHETWQIAMDGTQKLPQRLIEPATIALEQGLPLEPYAFAVAAWMRYALGVKENGEKYALRDPRAGRDRRADRRVSAPPARSSTGCSACPGYSPRNWRARTNGRAR